MSAEKADPSVYPPPQHFLRDLGIFVDRVGESAVASLAVVPEILDAGGRPRMGVLATLVDVIAGETAIRAVLPSWTATSNLSIHVDEIPDTGTIEARARILRSGRQTVILEVELQSARDAHAIGIAQAGFSVLQARTDVQTGGHWARAPEARTEFATPTTGFRKSLLETMGLHFDADDPGVSHLERVPTYLINSLGALQGGAAAILLEAAAERFAAVLLSGTVRVRSLNIHYLKLGRVGPIRAEPTLIARTAGGLLVHVTLYDEGADDALLTVATVQVDEANPVA